MFKRSCFGEIITSTYWSILIPYSYIRKLAWTTVDPWAAQNAKIFRKINISSFCHAYSRARKHLAWWDKRFAFCHPDYCLLTCYNNKVVRVRTTNLDPVKNSGMFCPDLHSIAFTVWDSILVCTVLCRQCFMHFTPSIVSYRNRENFTNTRSSVWCPHTIWKIHEEILRKQIFYMHMYVSLNLFVRTSNICTCFRPPKEHTLNYSSASHTKNQANLLVVPIKISS